jgi:hypothetical protein
MHACVHHGARPSQIQVGTFDSAVELEQLALNTPPEALFIDEEVQRSTRRPKPCSLT